MAECAERDFLDTPFSEDELELIMAVCDAFGKYSGPKLSKFTHKEAPWVDARTRAGATEGEKSNEPITLESIEGYFTEVTRKYEIRSVKDMRRYAEIAEAGGLGYAEARTTPTGWSAYAFRKRQLSSMPRGPEIPA